MFIKNIICNFIAINPTIFILYISSSSTQHCIMEKLITLEEELRELIAESRIVLMENKASVSESKQVLAKLKKTLNGFLIVGIPTIIAFFVTYVSNSNRMTAIETTRLTTEQTDAKYASKQSVIFMQNDIFDLNNSVYKLEEWVVTADVEKEYVKILKEFNGDVSRGTAQ